MGQNNFSKIYFRGNKRRICLIIMIMSILFLGIMLSGAMQEIAKNGKKDAFLYNGAAIGVESSSGDTVITADQIEQIKKMEHVLGINEWKENLAMPLDAANVKDYAGANPENGSTGSEKADKVVFLEDLSVELNSRFRCERNVSLIEGAYPTYENKGILIEERMAKQNNLQIGDQMRFRIDETGVECRYAICGIYKVDSDFIITEDNTEGMDIFTHSPYNVIFIEYQHAYESMKLGQQEDFAIYGGCQIYVDSYENIKNVARQLQKVFGSEYVFYNLAENYLKSSGSAAVLMEQYAAIMKTAITIAGSLTVLLIFSLFSKQFEMETGILLALGKTKRKILLQYLIIMIRIVVLGLLGGLLVYFLGSGLLLNGINQLLENIISKANAGSGVTSLYETPGLGLGFSLVIRKEDLFRMNSLFMIMGESALLMAVSMIFPVYRMITVTPRKMLEQKWS